MSQRYSLLTDVRVKFLEALVLQNRLEILQQMVALAERSVGQSNELLQAKQVARLDVVQLEVDAERLRSDLEATEQELPGAYRELRAAVGFSDLSLQSVSGALTDDIPAYDLDSVQTLVLASHPEIYAARQGVERARLLIQRARAEPVPNVSVDTGYVRQNQNDSNDYRIGASMTVPLWNRNQGNIRAAEAEYREAQQQVRQVQMELTERAAVAMRDYAGARRRAERYATAILPRALETYDLSRQAYQGGEFEYLRILEAQRALAQAHLDHIRALGDAWKAAAVLSGLTLEDTWGVPDFHMAPLPPPEPVQE
jgi:cobalt-zinc-cadmium efflux system outer membrane protein